jgi:hemolysin activation/secretion protein
LLEGNEIYSQAELLAVLADVTGKAYDLAGLNGIANQLSEYYRERGYSFAKAFIPQQEISDGQLRIVIREGKYGKIQVTGEDASLNRQATGYLSALKSGAVIDSAPLERASLILGELPGIKAEPVIQTGEAEGTADLTLDVKRNKPYSLNIGLDNYGSRYTGRNEAKVNLSVNSPFMLGDQFTLSAMYTDEQMWFGTLGYSLPIASSGLRGNVGYSHNYYQLGKEFADLGAKGLSDVLSAGLSYPIVKSQRMNLSLAATLQYKWLNDTPSAVSSTTKKTSRSLPLALSFDAKDSLLGGGLNYGAVTWTMGTISLDEQLKANDVNNTAGSFHKLLLDVARIQSLPANFSFFIRGSAQTANKNLDSSEGFGIGGIYGVRAYASDAAFGNIGWLAQTELRYQVNQNVMPYAYYDMGSSTPNKDATGPNPTRKLKGAGLGLRFNKGSFSSDISAAWWINEDQQARNSKESSPRFWATVSYQF